MYARLTFPLVRYSRFIQTKVTTTQRANTRGRHADVSDPRLHFQFSFEADEEGTKIPGPGMTHTGSWGDEPHTVDAMHICR